MTSEVSPVDICNRALQAIGAQAFVSSIDPSDGSTEGDACSILYSSRMQSISRAAHWNFARKQRTLTQLKAGVVNGAVSTDPPPVPWMYEYAYPEDCLQARYLIPFFNPLAGQPSIPFTTGETPFPQYWSTASIPFVVGTDVDANQEPFRVILTNHPQAILVYTADYTEKPSLWDPHFAIAAETYLAMWLVNSLARNRELWADQARLVQEIVGQARISDGNEGTPQNDHLPDWIEVRGALGARGWPFDNNCYYGWSTLGFPSGMAF